METIYREFRAVASSSLSRHYPGIDGPRYRCDALNGRATRVKAGFHAKLI
jgi:hypothetical protein